MIERHAKRIRLPKVARPLRLVGGRLEGPDLPTLEELATLFKCRRETIWSWRENNGFPAGLRIGGLLRFEREKVEAWIRARATRRGPEAA